MVAEAVPVASADTMTALMCCRLRMPLRIHGDSIYLATPSLPAAETFLFIEKVTRVKTVKGGGAPSAHPAATYSTETYVIDLLSVGQLPLPRTLILHLRGRGEGERYEEKGVGCVRHYTHPHTESLSTPGQWKHSRVSLKGREPPRYPCSTLDLQV